MDRSKIGKMFKNMLTPWGEELPAAKAKAPTVRVFL